MVGLLASDSVDRRCPVGEPLHPGLLLDGLYCLRPVCIAHPADSVRRRHTCEDGHARQRGAGAPAAPEAANLDELAPLRSAKGVRDLLCGQLRVLGQAEVLPVDNLRGPRRLPLRIQVETERALGIVDRTVGDRRRAGWRFRRESGRSPSAKLYGPTW